jgi:hypothetical protein
MKRPENLVEQLIGEAARIIRIEIAAESLTKIGIGSGGGEQQGEAIQPERRGPFDPCLIRQHALEEAHGQAELSRQFVTRVVSFVGFHAPPEVLAHPAEVAAECVRFR